MLIKSYCLAPWRRFELTISNHMNAMASSTPGSNPTVARYNASLARSKTNYFLLYVL
jgi:hypothetical protein